MSHRMLHSLKQWDLEIISSIPDRIFMENKNTRDKMQLIKMFSSGFHFG